MTTYLKGHHQMNPKIVATAFGLAVGIAGKFYVNRVLDRTMKSMIANRKLQTERVVLADVPEAPESPKTSKFCQCKPTHK
jgi:hypothetical protein